MRRTNLIVALACSVAVGSCSSAGGTSTGESVHHTVASGPTLDVRVGLTPILDGGSAGWCIATTDMSMKGSETVCSGARTSKGPILVVTCSAEVTPNISANVLVLTRSDVAAVRVDGGRPVSTESNSTLPAGLRGAAIELPGYRIVPKSFTVGYPWRPCPLVTPLNASGKLIGQHGGSDSPLSVQMPRRQWRAPEHQPSGACRLTSTRLPRETVASEGTVAIRIKSFSHLLGQAFISCAETSYLYMKEHELPAAVLIDARHPGTVPTGLPGMKPLAGHPSVFEAPPNKFARRIRGAWLVVQEEDNIGPRLPVELLEHLRATVGPR